MRLGALLPLLILAVIGRSLLRVDVENLAMKSVGTATDEVASVRAREFGKDPHVVLLATPRAPDVLSPIDTREIGDWIQELRSRPEVTSLENAPTTHPGEELVAVTLRADDEGRYADSVASLGAAARASVPPTYRLALAGVPVVEVAIANEMSAERARILPVIVLALALVLFLVYRNPVLVLGALLAPLTGVFLIEGLQGLLGLAVDPVSSLLGPAVLTVGVASSVHVLERYRRNLQGDAPVRAASVIAAHQLRLPLLLTVVTTVAGFLGLLASPIPAVRRFGLLASGGVVFATATTLLCLPSLLRLLHRPRRRASVAKPRAELFHPLWLRRWSGVLIGASLVITVAGATFMRNTPVDSNPLHVLSESNLARADSETLARQLGGSEVFELLLPPGGPADPFSTLGLVARVRDIDGVAGPAGRPLRSENGYQLLSFLLAPGGSAQREVVFGRAEACAREAGWEGTGATGLAVRVARDSNDLVSGQRQGILLTLLALWLVMGFGFRSAWLGLLGLIPNVFPLVLIQGTLGFLGHPLSVVSSMIGTVMLGLVVDDTIHLLHAYRTARGAPVPRMARAFLEVRRPIVITTAVLLIGFAATLVGQLQATREFGGLAAATLIIALLADLLLLPALLLWNPTRVFRRSWKRQPSCLERPGTTS